MSGFVIIYDQSKIHPITLFYLLRPLYYKDLDAEPCSVPKPYTHQAPLTGKAISSILQSKPLTKPLSATVKLTSVKSLVFLLFGLWTLAGLQGFSLQGFGFGLLGGSSDVGAFWN